MFRPQDVVLCLVILILLGWLGVFGPLSKDSGLGDRSSEVCPSSLQVAHGMEGVCTSDGQEQRQLGWYRLSLSFVAAPYLPKLPHEGGHLSLSEEPFNWVWEKYQESQKALTERGLASWYDLPGNKTASGAPYRASAMCAAHRTRAFGEIARIKAVGGTVWISVRINDRGPYVKGRIIDLTPRAFRALGVPLSRGIIEVEVEWTG